MVLGVRRVLRLAVASAFELVYTPSVGRDAADERCLPRAIDDEPFLPLCILTTPQI